MPRVVVVGQYRFFFYSNESTEPRHFWYPRLLHASPEQRGEWELIGDGEGIHWPKVDEDLSVEGILRGTPAPQARRDT